MQIITPTYSNNWHFPDVENADREGLLQIGGDLSADKVLEALSKGIFPWYNHQEPVLWWCPDPRFVLFPRELHISQSMRKLINQQKFSFQINSSFRRVINYCKTVNRAGQYGTWITNEIEAVYTELHHRGYAHCGEAWKNGNLVGGVYGVLIGKVFFAESMFSLESNASKFALISLIQKLHGEGIQLIDCQVYSSHVETLGARLIPRSKFVQLLSQLTT